MKLGIAVLLLCGLVTAFASKLSPVIIIPGDGGNQLEARLNKKPDNTGCPIKRGWYRLWLDVWKLSGSNLRCWADNIKLRYNFTSGTSSNMPGVETRVVGWGDTDTIEYLDPSWSAWALADAGNYMKDLVEFLTSLGYQKRRSLRGAPYDFRFGPHSQDKFFSDLKHLIEETYTSNENTPVTIISHSMGGLFGLHFLHQQEPSWKQKYIKRFIPLSTPWVGAVIQLNTYASGYNLGISVIDPAVIREEQRSYETGVYILPHPRLWPDQNETLVYTPTKNYTVRDYDQFFQDIGFPQGIPMLRNVVNYVNLRNPGVPVACIYSLGVKTAKGMIYSAKEFPDMQPRRIIGDGDGTVSKKSLEMCNRLTTLHDNEVRDETEPAVISGPSIVKTFQGPSHGEILKDKSVFKYLQYLLEL